MQGRRFRYVGPTEIRDHAVTLDAVTVDAVAALDGWLAALPRAERTEPVTFVVDADGGLVLGHRRSEHVALAGGRDVLAAGEITFAPDGSGWRVSEVSNQSTGYCPDPECWPAVARALDAVGLPRPAAFTTTVVFRRCEACGERNIVRDDDFTCALCDSPLPGHWNFTPGRPESPSR